MNHANPHEFPAAQDFRVVDTLGETFSGAKRDWAVWDRFRVVHYITRSWSDYEDKLRRGFADQDQPRPDLWGELNRNDELDMSMAMRIPELHRWLREFLGGGGAGTGEAGGVFDQLRQTEFLAACQAVAAECGFDHNAHVGELQGVADVPAAAQAAGSRPGKGARPRGTGRRFRCPPGGGPIARAHAERWATLRRALPPDWQTSATRRAFTAFGKWRDQHQEAGHRPAAGGADPAQEPLALHGLFQDGGGDLHDAGADLGAVSAAAGQPDWSENSGGDWGCATRPCGWAAARWTRNLAVAWFLK